MVLGCFVSLSMYSGLLQPAGIKMNKRRGSFQHEAAEEATERKTRNAGEKDDGA